MSKLFPITIKKKTIQLTDDEIKSVLMQIMINDEYRNKANEIIKYYENDPIDDSQIGIFSEN